jgi:hypothetical protein
MPTLIRLLVILLVLAGVVYGAMWGLVMLVPVPEKQVTIRIPARDLVASPEAGPIVRREIDTSRPVTPATVPDVPAVVQPAEPPAAPAALAAPETSTGDDSSVVTLSPGVE